MLFRSVEDGQHGQTVVIKDVQKVGELFVHKALYDQGHEIRVGQTVRAEVAPEPRARTAAHHSATHLLHSALKKILGEHVSQAGSLVGPKGARFDFNCQRGLTPDERSRIETLVNRWIFQNTARETRVMDIDTAKAEGAVAMFGEKYGDSVRVVSLGEVSKELCGGTHVERTGDIGLFRILSEGSIASGVRRIEFVVGDLALFEMQKIERLLADISETLKTPANELAAGVEKLLAESKRKEKRIRELSERDAARQIANLLEAHAGRSDVITQVEVSDAELLKWMTEQLAQRLGASHAITLGAAIDGKAMFCASVSEDRIKTGLKASDLVKEAATICEGGGGGKPNFAQAGGKNAAKIAQALEAIQKIASIKLPV